MTSLKMDIRFAVLGLSLCWLFILAVIAPVANAAEGKEGKSGPDVIRIVGSGYTMPLFMNPWARAFEKKTGTTVEVFPTGTSTASPALLNGEAEIAAMTRPLNEAEARVLKEFFGAEAIELPVAEDEVAVFVHKDNPLSRMTLEELDAVYSKRRRCGGASDVMKWGELGVAGELASRRVALFGRRTGSGTGSFFRARALCGGEFKDWMRISPGRESAAIGVRESEFGIGFGSLRDQKPGMKILSLAETEAGPFIFPGKANGGSGEYPLARTLNFVIIASPRSSPSERVLEFLEFVYEKASQAEVERSGFRALSEELKAQSLSRIRAITSD